MLPSSGCLLRTGSHHILNLRPGPNLFDRCSGFDRCVTEPGTSLALELEKKVPPFKWIEDIHLRSRFLCFFLDLTYPSIHFLNPFSFLVPTTILFFLELSLSLLS